MGCGKSTRRRRPVDDRGCLLTNGGPAFYNLTALAIIKPAIK
jgi:hypothetical protein